MAESCKLRSLAFCSARQYDSSGIHSRERKNDGEAGTQKEKEGREKREAYKKKGLTRYDFITLYPAAELKILILCLSGCRARGFVAQFMVVKILPYGNRSHVLVDPENDSSI